MQWEQTEEGIWYSIRYTGPAAPCDHCGFTVGSDEPRVCFDNGIGPSRPGGHGKNNQYLCDECAEANYGVTV